MFERSRRQLSFRTIRETLTCEPTERTARYKDWAAHQLSNPPCCKSHPNTPMLPIPEQAKIWEVRKPGSNPDHPEFERDKFQFDLALRCPSCQAAYALCPPEFHTATFEGFDQSTLERARAVSVCREFVHQVNQRGRGFLVLSGAPGTGKTRLACSIVRELENSDSLYARQAALTAALRKNYGHKTVSLQKPQRDYDLDWYDGPPATDDASPPTVLETVQGVGFLVLDELGCTPLANDERLLFDELLKSRYDRGRPTAFITNLPLPALGEFIGDALADRLHQASGQGKFIVQFHGESYRRSPAGNNYL